MIILYNYHEHSWLATHCTTGVLSAVEMLPTVRSHSPNKHHYYRAYGQSVTYDGDAA